MAGPEDEPSPSSETRTPITEGQYLETLTNLEDGLDNTIAIAKQELCALVARRKIMEEQRVSIKQMKEDGLRIEFYRNGDEAIGIQGHAKPRAGFRPHRKSTL